MTTQSTGKRSGFTRAAMYIGVVLAAWHIFATFLWIAPTSPLREVVPGKALSSYMLPFFGQSWSVFAPVPVNGDSRISVRALVDDGKGKLTETEWVNATEVEISMIRHNLFPARAGIQSTVLSSGYRGAWNKLNDEQKKTVELNYFKDADWADRLASTLTNQAKGETAKATAFIAQDRKATAYATQVARALWGENVVRVQYQAIRQNIIPFANRNDPDAERPAARSIDAGWRGPIVEEGQSDEAFADVFRSTYEGITR